MSRFFTGYRITSPYGMRIHPISKKKSFHAGIDLVKSHKSPIYAFVEGVVQWAKWGATGTGFGGYGNVVAIRDKYNHLHVYAHLDSIVVKEGQRVSKGQEVGKQGDTGNSAGSHLHYEIRTKVSPSNGWNNHTDPEKYLESYFERELKERVIETMSKYFSDMKNEAQWKIDNVDKAFERKLINGRPDGTFNPNGNVTRAELATVANNIFDALVKELKNK